MKKKQKAPIVLSNQELIPSVIGVIDDKEKSGWLVLVLFILLIAFVIALPTVTTWIQGESDITYDPSSNNPKPNDPEKPTEEVTFYDISDSLEVSMDGLLYQKFKIQDNMFFMEITNVSQVQSYLSEHKLFLELYDEDKTLLQRLKLPIDNIRKGSSLPVTFSLNNTDSIRQIVIVEKNENDYPPVNMTQGDDGTYSLICKTDTNAVEYLFDEQGKLYYISDMTNFSSSMVGYSEMLVDYRQKTSKYNTINGVEANLIEVGTGFTSTIILDLNQIDFMNKTIRNVLNKPIYYALNTEGKVVSFELSALNYHCS